MMIKLQNLVFLDTEAQQNLFFLGKGCVSEEKRLLIREQQTIDFRTYFNSFPIKKWKMYTTISNLSVTIDALGEYDVVISEMTKRGKQLDEKIQIQSVCAKERNLTKIELPLSDATDIGIQIVAKSDVDFYGGFFGNEMEQHQLNEVKLAILTTTFKKEEYILGNLKKIRTQLLKDETLKENVWVHVVDNGRTLKREDVETEHIFYHPNKNVGGSGGFARGMIEALHQKENITNVLVMDDDIEIIPESIRRTFMLLTTLKKEYKQRVVSGAMLHYEEKDLFHEDVGYVDETGNHMAVKTSGKVSKREEFLELEQVNLDAYQNEYAAWWYCCMPIEMIKSNGLPLPIFVRGDDIDFGIRNQAKYITMNGICVWHMGFSTKFSYFMEYYQTCRNLLISGACNRWERKEDILKKFKGIFLSEILRFNYQAADIILDAILDYLRGPGFIEKEKCQECLQTMTARNAKLRPLQEFNIHVDETRVSEDANRNGIEKMIYRLTLNGHLFIPEKLLKKATGIIPYDWNYCPANMSLRRQVLSVNPYEHTAELRKLDKKKFWNIIRKYFGVMRTYQVRHQAVDKLYYEHRKLVTSEKFWNHYLEIEKYQ